MTRLMDLKYPNLDNMWIMNSNYQEWRNTTSKDMPERIAHRIARWRKLELLWKESRWTLREGIKSLMNHHVEPPWRTPVNKRNEKKEKLKTQGESLQWFRWISVIIRAWNSGKKRRWNKWNREFEGPPE